MEITNADNVLYISGFFALTNAIGKLANPEYYAIQEVVGYMKEQ